PNTFCINLTNQVIIDMNRIRTLVT
ncbi:MAG: hypothetical protein RLZZ226_2100, partial [Pseudomonadota bacterium]